MELQELDTLDLNEALAEILQAHGYACQTQGDKILPAFAVPVQLETWAFPREHANGAVVSRFDVGMTLPDGRELYECCGDIGENLEEALSRNLHSFCTNSLHVLPDAFNPGENHLPARNLDSPQRQPFPSHLRQLDNEKSGRSHRRRQCGNNRRHHPRSTGKYTANSHLQSKPHSAIPSTPLLLRPIGQRNNERGIYD